MIRIDSHDQSTLAALIVHIGKVCCVTCKHTIKKSTANGNIGSSTTSNQLASESIAVLPTFVVCSDPAATIRDAAVASPSPPAAAPTAFC